jgi:hypothetical protein
MARLGCAATLESRASNCSDRKSKGAFQPDLFFDVFETLGVGHIGTIPAAGSVRAPSNATLRNVALGMAGNCQCNLLEDRCCAPVAECNVLPTRVRRIHGKPVQRPMGGMCDQSEEVDQEEPASAPSLVVLERETRLPAHTRQRCEIMGVAESAVCPTTPMARISGPRLVTAQQRCE